MGSVEVQFLGSGDAFGSGGRFNTCFLVRWSGPAFLIDCGASSLIAMRKFGVDPNEIDLILLSHLHGDHFGGLPFFILDAQVVSKRSNRLLIAGPPGTEKRVMDSMEVNFPGSSKSDRKFKLEFEELAAERAHRIGGSNGGPVVTPYLVKHPSGAPSYALRVQVGEKTITYTGDTEWTESLISAAEGADLLIAECYQYDKSVKYHLNLETWKEKLPALGAKRVVLTHMGADMLSRRGEIEIECAEDGKVIEV